MQEIVETENFQPLYKLSFSTCVNIPISRFIDRLLTSMISCGRAFWIKVDCPTWVNTTYKHFISYKKNISCQFPQKIFNIQKTLEYSYLCSNISCHKVPEKSIGHYQFLIGDRRNNIILNVVNHIRFHNNNSQMNFWPRLIPNINHLKVYYVRYMLDV